MLGRKGIGAAIQAILRHLRPGACRVPSNILQHAARVSTADARLDLTERFADGRADAIEILARS